MSFRSAGGGQTIIVAAVILLVIGLLVSAVEKGRLWRGGWRLPGDIAYHRGPVHIWIPVGTSIVVSIILTVLLNLIVRR